jgi:hypothetical protein
VTTSFTLPEDIGSTAATLKARAAERGLTVSELVAELATVHCEPTGLEPSEVAELDRRWKKVEAGGATVSNSDVVPWASDVGNARLPSVA